MKIIATIITLLLCLPVNAGKPNGDDVPDSRKLGMAIDYFGGGKYHEALVLFVKLDKKYKLNPRFKAYIGICYYHEWEYDKACEYLDEAIPHLDVYSPAERNVYYNAAAESHFLINEFDKAIPLYEKQLRRRISGLLGSDFLVKFKAVIDYENKYLRLKVSD